VARPTTAVANLRAAIGEFLRAAETDRTLAPLADDARKLDTQLRQGGGDRPEAAPSPGQRAAGMTEAQRGGPADARASTTSRARERMGGPASSAKGDDSNLPPFMRRAKRSQQRGGGS
jgi:hypothetical protein